MKTVGVRKLKEHLSKYVNEVKSGERIVITDRKRKVALIVPIGIDTEQDRILECVRRGIVHWSGGKPVGMGSRIHVKGKKISETVLDDRG